jgi:hypothetical protein
VGTSAMAVSIILCVYPLVVVGGNVSTMFA